MPKLGEIIKRKLKKLKRKETVVDRFWKGTPTEADKDKFLLHHRRDRELRQRKKDLGF